MEEWEIATALRGARPHRRHDAIPPALRPWLLDAEWDLNRLHAIERPVSAVPVATLRWCYELPWWRGDDNAWFTVTPREVMRNPGRYPNHDARIASADVSRPLHVLRRHSHWMVLDGIHRLVRADLDGARRVRVVPLGRQQLTRVVVRDDRQLVSCAIRSSSDATTS
jgi:hypothetical protein